MAEQTIKSILIIEDDKTLGEIIARKLENSGYETSLVTDGAEGLKAIKEKLPDLILLDIVLPNMNGYEILEAKQKDETISSIPVIVLSNSGQPVEISHVLSLGVKGYLVKANFSPDEVLEKVKEFESSNNEKGGLLGLEGIKILVVEDDTFLRDMLARKLSGEHCAVSYAIDGEKALELIRKEKPDIVLLDIILPTMSGFDVLGDIKSNANLKNTPVIILSNLGQKEDIEKGKKLGASEYLIKANVSIGEILASIKNILQKEGKVAK